MHYLSLAVGFIAGAVACAVYNYFFSAKFAKVGADIVSKIEALAKKV